MTGDRARGNAATQEKGFAKSTRQVSDGRYPVIGGRRESL